MSLEKCPICKEYKWAGDYVCPPVFEFLYEDWGEEWQKIRAWDVPDAAKRFARMYNEDGDYSLVGSSIDVKIREEGSNITYNFRVSAEPSIDYSVEELSREEL